MRAVHRPCRLWLDDLRKRDSELADQVYIFNSFFYKMLSTDKKSCVCTSNQTLTTILTLVQGRGSIPQRAQVDVEG